MRRVCRLRFGKEFFLKRKSIIIVGGFCLLSLVLQGCAGAPVKHVIVYKEAGRFCGWPANYGTWSWGNEILVGFKLGYYQAKERGHSMNRDKLTENVMARSLDGELAKYKTFIWPPAGERGGW